MAGYNRIILIGNLTRDPEYKQLTSGQAVCRLGLTTNRQFKNRQTGAMVQEVCYIDIDVWGAQVESCRQYLQKGRPVLIEGRLKLDTWEDQNGQNRSKHSVVADRVVFLGNGGAAQDVEEVSAGAMADQKRPEPQSELEKDLFNQIDSIKERAAKGAKKVPSKQTGEIDFKDEPPFEEELPF